MMKYCKPIIISHCSNDFESIVSCQYTGSLQITFQQASVVMREEKTPYSYACNVSEMHANETVITIG